MRAGLGRRRAERHQVDALAWVLAAGEVHAEARRHVLDDLPAVDVPREAAGIAVERRRRPVEDPARQAHQALFALRGRRKLGDRRGADRGGVHVREVRHVEDIVRDELVVAFHVDRIRPRERPVRMLGPPPVRDQRRIGPRRVAHPDPYPAILLEHRIRAHARLRRDSALAGDLHALSGRVEKQPVIAAAQAIAFEAPARQRQMAVAAAVFQRHGAPRLGAEENHRLIEESARERRARHLAIPGGDIPGMTQVAAQTARASTTSACAL